MIHYYIEAIYEAIVYCIVGGFSETYVMDLDVWGFGQIYKYIKRIETRKQLNLVGMLRTAPNANGKQYKEFLESLNTWLPIQERNIEKGNPEDFKKLVARGGL